MAKKKDKYDFVWNATRISFWVMIGLWVMAVVYNIPETTTSFYGVFALVGIFTFVMSIIHLCTQKSKFLAVTALVLSSIIVLAFVIGMIIGLVMASQVS